MVFLQIEELVYLGKYSTLNSKKTVGGIIENRKEKAQNLESEQLYWNKGHLTCDLGQSWFTTQHY